MIRFCTVALTLVCLACAVSPACAQPTLPPDRIIAVRAAQPPPERLDIVDPAWTSGTLPGSDRWVNLTRRRRANVRTRVSLLYDDTALYVRFDCDQPGTPVVATQSTNDVGFGLDDFVGIGIDTSGSGSQVYFFETTARGVRYQQASESNRYRPVWSARGSITAAGWSGMMTIPLSALKFHSGAGGATWRINVFRSVSALNERFTWAYDPIMQDAPAGNGWPSFLEARFWPHIGALRIAAPRMRRTPSVDIYALGSGGGDNGSFVAPNGALERERARNFGLDVSLPLTETATLVATAAPDFSNVEYDQQTIAPQEFARQLKEYRPFFAQGAQYINANPYPPGAYVAPGDLLFYTPNIGPFDRGVKVEGTAGNQSFGAMSFRGYDAPNSIVFDDAAFGYKHALPDRTFQYWSDGVLAHHSDVDDRTTEFGLGGRNNRTGFVWQADDAFEHRIDAAIHSEHSANAFVDVHRGNYEANATYRDVSADYGPIDGFTALADLRGPSTALNLSGEAAGFKNVGLQLYADRYLDGSGAVHQADTYAYLTAALKNGWSIDTLGPATGVLRSYDIFASTDCAGQALGRSGYSGSPCYRNGRTDRFNLFNAAVGYREGTSAPLLLSYAIGPFGPAYIHQYSAQTSRPLGARLSLGFEYDGTVQRALGDGGLDSQWLRRLSLGIALGGDENLTFSVRAINGAGGYAVPGVNLAAGYHKRYRNGNDLYADFGTPAAARTLHRVIVKYVLHLGPLRS